MARVFNAAAAPAMALALVATACTSQQATPLDVKAPWSDGESTSYVIQNRQGAQVGTAVFGVAKEGDAYVLTQLYELGSVQDDITMRVRADDLKPIGGHREVTTAQGVTTIDTEYRNGKLAIKAKTAQGEDRSAEIDVPADAYDNDQALFLWRAIPFAEGHKVSYTNVVAGNATKPRVTVTVVGKEKVSTPAGEYEAWKMEMEAGQQKQYLWYGVGEPHHLLKYDNGSTIFLLDKHS